MTTKKDLAALPSETPGPLRRGRGLRLSRAGKQSKQLAREVGVQLEAPPPAPEPPAKPAAVATQPIETVGDAPAADFELDSEAGAPTKPDRLKPLREKRKLQLRKDLLKQCKRIARAQDRKLYQVIESALEDYIDRHGARE